MTSLSSSSRAIGIALGMGLGLSAALLSPRAARADNDSVRAATPPELLDRKNPIDATPEDLARAATLFAANCALCHGANGDGHGPASRTLHPRPMDFTNAEEMAKIKDGQLFFAISSGSHGTAMPPFSQQFDESDRWRLVSYLRELANEKAEKKD